jgi:hypothetical protein
MRRPRLVEGTGMEKQLTRCMECYAYVDSSLSHKNWHAKQKRTLRELEEAVEKLQRATR